MPVVHHCGRVSRPVSGFGQCVARGPVCIDVMLYHTGHTTALVDQLHEYQRASCRFTDGPDELRRRLRRDGFAVSCWNADGPLQGTRLLRPNSVGSHLLRRHFRSARRSRLVGYIYAEIS